MEPYLFKTEKEWQSWRSLRSQGPPKVTIWGDPEQFPCFVIADYVPNPYGPDDYNLFFIYQDESGQWDIDRALLG